jgi:NAD(P)-dependent dehydrogenase (short-subunit alcohol dehydrogenase family)
MTTTEQSLTGGVVVTGGGAGIGRAVALACARRGAAVAVLDLDGATARDAAAEAESAGAPATSGLQCDVRDESAVASAVAAAAEEIGPVLGLSACAGIFREALVHELDLDEWSNLLAVNLTGTFLACKHVLRLMIDQGDGGSIVCTSSPWAEVSAPGGASAYCASKGGISALVRSLALDYAPHRIRVNAIVPGATETALTWGDMSAEDIPAAREQIAARLPLGRLGDPSDIAEGVAWMLSERSSYMTGAHLVIDGGLMARAGIDS